MTPKPYWTKERIFEALRAWEKEHKKLPNSVEWKLADRDGDVIHPSSRHVSILFGGWKDALAEYEEYRERTKKRWKRWSAEEIIEAFQRWYKENGRPPTWKELSSHHDGSLPSMTAVKSRMGSYEAAMQAAGLPLLPQGVTYRSLAKYKPLPRKGDE